MDNLNLSNRYTNSVLWLIGFCVAIFILVYFKSLLKPLMLAMIIWYLVRGLNRLMGKIRIRNQQLPRWLRSLGSILVVVLLIYALDRIVTYNVNAIIDNYPRYEENFDKFLLGIGNAMGIDDVAIRLEKWAGGLELRRVLTSTVSEFGSFVANLAVVIIYVVFLLYEEKLFPSKLNFLYKSQAKRRDALLVFERIDYSMRHYLTIKTNMSLLTGTLSYIILLILGIDFAFLWALIIFLFNYIPYIGSLVATLLPSIFAILQFGSVWPGLWTLALVESVQILVGTYIEPRIMGKSLNLSPFVVMIALAFWGFTWDVLGMFLSVPLTSMIVIIMAQFPNTKNVAVLLSESGDISDFLIEPPESEKEEMAEAMESIE